MSLDSRNKKLDQKISDTDLPAAVAILITDARKRKNQVRWLAISILLDILLTVGLGSVSIRTQHIASSAENSHMAIINNCETSNEARANNKQLWDYLLTLPTPNAPTIQQQQVRDNFTKFVDKTFALRDCSAIK